MTVTLEASTDPAIPVVDLSAFYSGSPEEALSTSKKLYAAFKGVGFAYLKNHGVPQDLVDEAFSWVSSGIVLSS